MRYLYSILILWTGFQVQLYSQSFSDSTYLHALQPIQHSAEFCSETLLQNNLSQIIDNFLDDSHVHLESTAGYDLPNPYQISFLGGATDWTRYYFDGIRIDNQLRKGDAAYHYSISQKDINIDRLYNSIYLKPANKSTDFIKTGLTGPGIGDRVGFTDWFINNISGHESAQQRETFPLDVRPELNYQSQFSLQRTISNNPLNIDFFIGSRSHLDQDYSGKNNVYSENYWQANLHGTLISSPFFPGGKLKYLTSIRSRSHDLAEFNYKQSETRASQEWHQMLYSSSINETTEQSISIQLSNHSFTKNQPDFIRNVLDQDGEGMSPYYQDGNQRAWTVAYHRKQKRSKNSPWYVALDMYNSILTFRPDQSSFRTQLFYQYSDSNYHPLSTTSWQSRNFNGGLLENSWTIGLEKENGSISYLAQGGLQLNGMILTSESIIDLKPFIDLGLNWQFANHWTLGWRSYFRANPFNIEHLQYLSPDYLDGQTHYWNDENSDRIFTENEKGISKATTGGKYRFPSNEIGTSSTLHLEMPITYQSGSLQLTLLPQYRQYRNTWHTQYDGNPEHHGIYQDLGNRAIFIQKSASTKFKVVSYPTTRMGVDSWFFNQPFYAGATLRAQKETENWFFSASFTANMMVGASSFGNGVLHNQLNILSESTADPNLRENQVGRLDGERSFISRWLLRKKWKKNKFLTFQIKYKDGQSFANYDHFLFQEEEGNSIAFIQREVRGDNPLNKDRGRREDFLLNLDCRYRYVLPVDNGKLSFEIHGYNLLDFGNETLEYTFGNINGFDRAPLELQVPRTFSVFIGYEWR